MKTLLVCLMAASSLFAAAAQAAPVNTESGTRAMVFSFRGLSDLDLFGYEGGIGLRYYVKDDWAIRPGLVFAYSSDEMKGNDGYSDAKRTISTIGFSAALEKHMSGPPDVSPFVGLGVGFRYTKNVDERSVPPNPSPGYYLKDTETFPTYRVFALLGFEWSFTESLTLGGESQLGLQISGFERERELHEMDPEVSTDRSTLSLEIGTVALFLSVNW